MATAEEGGATTTTTSSYGGGGGGGAGGKFRRKPFRKTTTPYDRPAIALRGNGGNSSWLSKLVVDPASKLISYGARRFFESVFRKRRLPPPPIPPPPPLAQEPNHVLSAGLQEAVTNEPAGGECSQPIRNSGRNGISDLEQLLKQKTFTRSEIDHLTDLLHSRAGEVSLRDDGKRNEETISDFGMRQQIESGPTEANRNKGDRSHGHVSTPISNSKVLGDSIASPAELAKAYMGSRPSELSPSTLDSYSQVTKEDTKLLRNMRIASKPVSMSLTTKTAAGSGSPENGYITKPRSFGRSAIYNMSRSVHLKRTGINNNGYAGLPMPSTSLSIMENRERFEPKSMTLKRRSSVLDDEVGYVSPIRRIRQKSNLIAAGVPHIDRVGRNSDAIPVSSKQKLSLIGDLKHVQRTVEENADNSTPSTSYAIVPSKSNDVEVAAKRLGSLRKTALKDKPSESKVVGVRQMSPFKLTPSMLCGQALRSMEDLTSSELLLNVQEDHKFESNADLLDAHDSTLQELGKVEENSHVETSAPSNTDYPVINSDSAVSFEASLVRDGTSDDQENGLSQPQNRAAFRMSALEDYIDMDDDLPCNGVASLPSSEKRLPLEAHLTDSKRSPPEEPKVLGTTIQAELKSPSDLTLSNTNELSNAVAGADSLREQSNGIINTALPTVPPLSVAVFDKPKEINNPPSPFSLSSKVTDKLHVLMPESSSRASETKPESSSSLLNASAPTSSMAIVAEPENGGNVKPLAAEDTSGKSDTFPFAASNGPLVSGASTGLLTFTSNNNAHQVSTAAPAIFTPSVSVSDFTPSGTGSSLNSASSSGIIFGASEITKVSGKPAFQFGASPDPSTKVSAASTTITPAGDLKNEAVTNPSSGNSSISPSNFVTFGTPNSGNMTSGLSLSTSNPSANNTQGSLFSSASKSFVNAVGTVSQGTSAQSISVAPPPSSNMNSSTFVSSLPGSQVSSPVVSFGFNSSASLSGAAVSSSGSTSSLFGVNPSAVSVGSAGGSSSLTTPSVFSFQSTGGSLFSSSSSSTNAVGSTGGATAPAFSFGVSSSGSASATTSPFSNSSSSTGAVGSSGAALNTFGFGLSSSASASVSNAASSFSNGALGGFSFGGSSSASTSAINSVNSNNAPSNVFGSSLQAPTSSIFGSSPATGFSFGASATSSAPINAAPIVFNSSTAPPSSSPFSFSSAPSVFSSLSPSLGQPVFGNPAPGFSASSPGNNQMNAEDSMAEDPVQSTAPSFPVFGQANMSPSPPPSGGFMFGSTVTPQASPFQFGGQQNQGVPQNPPMFQASSSLEFNAGGSFSLGSGGGDKSGRKFVKANRNKNRKK